MKNPRVIAAALALTLSGGCSLIFGNDLEDYRYDRCLQSSESCAPRAGAGGEPVRIGGGGTTPAQGGAAGADVGGAGGAVGAAGAAGTYPAGAPGVVEPNPSTVRSCSGLPAGCGPSANDDCCASDLVDAGSFTMGNDTSDDPADRPSHIVYLDSFRLDRYEATVGRFRRFVDAYDDWQKPEENEGAYRSEPDSGWRTEWNALLPATAEALRESLKCTWTTAPTWTDIPDGEFLAVSCVRWFEAYAFCIWDGGRLPTEAEWEYAAVGGSQQRAYPWGDDFDPNLVNYNNYLRVIRVGAAGQGMDRGYFGQYDLIGNVWEWTRDRHDPEFYSSPFAAVNPLNPFIAAYPVVRGASFLQSPDEWLTTYHRVWAVPDEANSSIGVRCARDS